VKQSILHQLSRRRILPHTHSCTRRAACHPFKAGSVYLKAKRSLTQFPQLAEALPLSSVLSETRSRGKLGRARAWRYPADKKGY
jgi:hypothetical protein